MTITRLIALGVAMCAAPGLGCQPRATPAENPQFAPSDPPPTRPFTEQYIGHFQLKDHVVSSLPGPAHAGKRGYTETVLMRFDGDETMVMSVVHRFDPPSQCQPSSYPPSSTSPAPQACNAGSSQRNGHKILYMSIARLKDAGQPDQVILHFVRVFPDGPAPVLDDLKLHCQAPGTRVTIAGAPDVPPSKDTLYCRKLTNWPHQDGYNTTEHLVLTKIADG